MEKKVYIIGHRNPDADSVVSAAAYEQLKHSQGQDYYHAARAGKLNPQTEYIFTRFGVPVPEFLPDLIPKAEHYISGIPSTVFEEDSVWNALELLEKNDSKVLPIVDRNGAYRSMLHYQDFAHFIIANINPRKKSAFPLSLDSLAATLHAQPMTLYNGGEIRKSSIIVAASYSEHFREYIRVEGSGNPLVIVGDRWDIQEQCIEARVRALILSSGNVPSKKIIEMAEEKQVTVLISPFDTSSTAMLIIYSVNVGNLGDVSVPLIRLNDPVRTFRDTLSKAPSRCLAVGDKESKVVGVISEGNLAKEPNVEVVLVDHNEPSQAVEGIENYKILEIIDHHRLGNLSTHYPITFINRVVGATCTVITNLYREHKIPLKKNIASILLCGILSDTLSLQSATTTETDIEAAEYLSSITGLDIKTLYQELLAAVSGINSLPAQELINMDMKEYAEQNATFTISQIETDNPGILVDRRNEIISALEEPRAAKSHLFTALLVTDVTALDSLLFMSGDKAFINHINFPVTAGGIYELKGVVSRKKQLTPLMSELVARYASSQ
jgi:manganese-dependent inorganic pyrophosphatase